MRYINRLFTYLLTYLLTTATLSILSISTAGKPGISDVARNFGFFWEGVKPIRLTFFSVLFPFLSSYLISRIFGAAYLFSYYFFEMYDREMKCKVCFFNINS